MDAAQDKVDKAKAVTDEAKAARDALTDDATEEEKTQAETALKDAEKALSKAEKKLAAAEAAAEQAKKLDAASRTSAGGTSTPVAQDSAKAALTTAVTEVKTVAADGYTEESYKALANAIAAAEALAKDPDATEQQIKDAAAAIEAAKAGLVSTTVNPGDTRIVEDQEYGVLTTSDEAEDTAAVGTTVLLHAKDQKAVTVPKTVKLSDGRTYKVVAIAAGAFSGKTKVRTVTVGANIQKIEQNAFAKSKVKTLVIKTKKLTKAKVKDSLKGSSVKTIRVKVGGKKVNKKFVKKYKKFFTKANAGRQVKVK